MSIKTLILWSLAVLCGLHELTSQPTQAQSQQKIFKGIRLDIPITDEAFPEAITVSFRKLKHFASIDRDSTLFYLDELMVWEKQLSSKKQKENLHQKLLSLCNSSDVPPVVQLILMDKLAQYAEKSEEGYFLFRLHRSISQFFYRQSRLDKALEYQQLAMQDIQSPGVPDYMEILPYVSMAHIHRGTTSGKMYADSAKTMLTKPNFYPPSIRYWAYTYLGTYYHFSDQLSSALSYFEKANQLVDEHEGLLAEPLLYLFWGELYVTEKNYSKALDLYQKANQVAESATQSFKVASIQIAEATANLGVISNNESLAQSSAQYLIKHANAPDFIDALLLANRILYRAASSSKSNFSTSDSTAQAHLDAYFSLREQQDSIKTENEKYFKNISLEITHKRSQVESIEKDLILHSYRNTATTIILLLTSLVLAFFYVTRRKERALNAILIDKNKQVKEYNDALLLANKKITVAKKKAEESDRLKTSILQNMSHEFRTPLTAIIGYAEIIGEENSVAHHIQRGGKRLMDTLSSILYMAELESEHIKLRTSSFNLANLTQNLLEKLQPLADEKGIELGLEIYHKDGFLVETDPEALEQILKNILHNAIRFTHSGSVKTYLMCVDPHVVIKIEDTGIGIKDEFLAHVFEPFIQESTGHGRTHEGVGLGLAISRQLVELIGGQISVVSEKGKKTVFTITLPIVAHKHEQA